MSDNDRLDRLESLVEQQQETIEAQRELIAELERDEATGSDPAVLNRRSALKAGGLLALLFGGVGTASADAQGQIGTGSDPLNAIHTEEINGGVTGESPLTDLLGDGLALSSNALTADLGSGLGFDGSNRVEVSSDGIGTDELDPSIAPTWTGAHTWDTDGGANLNVDESGAYYETSNAETLDLRNDGTGTLTLQEDGTAVVNESRSLIGGHAVQPLGDLSTDRTVAVDATALSGTYLSDSGRSSALSVNLGSGLEGDGNSPESIRVDTSAIAGENLTVDSTTNELVAASAAFEDSDGDGLLELTDASKDGIDVSTVRVTNIDDSGGSSHLTLNSGGPLALNQRLDTNGNGIQSDGSVGVDIDADGGGTGETFTVTKGGTTSLLTVNQSGEVDINNGDLDLNGNGITNSSGGLTFETNGSDRTLELGVPSSDSNSNTAGGNVVAGHPNNTVNNSAVGVVIGGGGSNVGANTASGDYATVAGGENNSATGHYSFAAGRNATAAFQGSFVWADSTDSSLTSAANDEFVAQASGGVYFYSSSDTSTGVRLFPGAGTWTSASTRTIKSNIDPVDERSVLERVEELAVSTWNYDAQDDDIRHMGPMAEEFYEAFGLGADDEHISSVDADGVALAAIQGLSEKLDERDERIEELEAENDDLEAETDRLRERLAAIEAELGIDATAGSDGGVAR